MKDRKECLHETLAFGSGDYYLFCRDCDARWAAVSTTQSKYGYDQMNNPVGADPSVANQGVRIAQPPGVKHGSS